MATGNGVANAALLQPDGKILLAGACANGSKEEFCAVRYDGRPFSYQNCQLDLDGDGQILATTDALIRNYLVTRCGMSLVL